MINARARGERPFRSVRSYLNRVTASNMSGVTMAQSAIAEDLDEYENAMWFSTTYLIATSALSPLVGRLATIFSPRSLSLPIAFFFAAGGIVTAMAKSFSIFILGRVLTGMAGAGIMTLSVILVLELTGKKSRGLFVGLVNCGFTIGLSTGAVVYGALLSAVGWVSVNPVFLTIMSAELLLQRFLSHPGTHRIDRRLRRVFQCARVTRCRSWLRRADRPREAGSHRLRRRLHSCEWFQRHGFPGTDIDRS